MNGSNLVAMLAILLVNVAFVMAVICNSYEPRWIASYIAVLLLYCTLYYRRFRHLPEELRRHLSKAAVTLVFFLTALFFYNFAPGVPWWVAGAVWLGLAAMAYFAYDVVMFDFEEEAAMV